MATAISKQLRQIVPGKREHNVVNEESPSLEPALDVIVHIVDDDDVVRRSLQVLIESAGYTTSCHGSAEAYLQNSRSDSPSVLVLDQRLPGLSGFELFSKLVNEESCPPTVFLSAHNSVRDAVNFLEHGAVTVLCKPCQGQELLTAVSRAIREAQQEHSQDRLQEELTQRLSNLTGQEQQVVDMMVDGMQNKQIAARLEVSLRTVENRRHKIFQKTQTTNIAELVRLVVANSLLKKEETQRESA